MRPVRRSITRRRTLLGHGAQHARRAAKRMGDEPDERALDEMLWAIAYLERAVALQTGCALGDVLATKRSVARRLEGERYPMRTVQGIGAAVPTALSAIIERAYEQATKPPAR